MITRLPSRYLVFMLAEPGWIQRDDCFALSAASARRMAAEHEHTSPSHIVVQRTCPNPVITALRLDRKLAGQPYFVRAGQDMVQS